MYLPLIVMYFIIPSSFSSNETMLLKKLLSQSSIFARPVLDKHKSLVVTFGLELIQVISLIEREQKILTKAWIRMSWMNEILRWNPMKYGNITATKLSRELIWTPDIFLREDISDEMSSGTEKFKTPIILESHGKHSWLIPVLFESSCSIDVAMFPFDHQSCPLTFLSWTHDQTEVDIKADSRPTVTKEFINSSEWLLQGVNITLHHIKYTCCANPYTNIKFRIRLKRMSLYYIYNVVVPCIIQMLIILFSFFLPPDSGERIGVVVTVLLVFAVYLDILSSSLPKTSNSNPTLSRFYVTAMIESACSLIATCFVLAIHFKGTEKGIRPMPKWTRNIFLVCIAKYVGIQLNFRAYSNDKLLSLMKKNFNKNDFKLEIPNGHTTGNDVSLLNIKEEDVENDTVYENKNADPLIHEVRVITSLIHDMNCQEEIEEEWQVLAKILDRLFCLVFLIIFLVSSLIIVVPALHYDNDLLE